MAVGKDVFKAEEKRQENQRRHAAIRNQAEQRERFRTNWIKNNRDAYLAAGCPDDIGPLVRKQVGELCDERSIPKETVLPEQPLVSRAPPKELF